MNKDRKTREIVVFAYSFASLVGTTLIAHHLFYYEMVFDVFSDDRKFYQWAIAYKLDLLATSYSIYEKLLAIILIIFNSIGVDDSPQLLFPINWLFFSLTVGSSYKLAYIITKKYLPFPLFFLVIFANYTFVQNSLHLYRDIYIAFFTLITLIAILENKQVKGFSYSIATLLFRLPNGVINLFFLLIRLFLEKTKKKMIHFLLLSFILMTVFSYATYSNMRIGKYSIGKLADYTTERTNRFSESILKTQGGMSFITGFPLPIRAVLNVPAQIIRPVKFQSHHKVLREGHTNSRVFNHRSLGWNITIVSLFILAGFYMRGIFIGIFTKDKNIMFFMIALFILANVIGLLSFLDRNRVFLIPLLPTLVALNYVDFKVRRRFKPLFAVIDIRVFNFSFFVLSIYLSTMT